MPVAITRDEHSAADLRRAAARSRDGAAARRMLALALVLEGESRAHAAALCGMDRQTLRDWVHRYNAEGLSGLADRPHPGRRPRLSPAQMRELERRVEDGPDPDRDGVVRWRRCDLRDWIAARFGLRFHERTISKLLHQLAFKKLSVRPQHPQSDPQAQEAFKENFPDLVRQALPEPAGSKPLEIWFQDEARVGQQGTLTRIWAKRGSRPRAPRDRRYKWAYLFGALCPARAAGAALVMPRAHAEAMSQHLAEISACVRPAAHAVVVLDGAGYHGAKRLVVPDNLTLLPLPPRAPELNPVENVWGYLRQNQLSLRVWADYEAIVATCCAAWNALMQSPERITSLTHRGWACLTPPNTPASQVST